MKRSFINQTIEDAISLFNERHIYLPPQLSWGLEEWAQNADMAEQWVKRGLGWDITDFGHDFKEYGAVLVTLSNAILDTPDQTFAFKYILRQDGQKAPTHAHFSKSELITCQGPGNLEVAIYTDAKILINYFERPIPSGHVITLEPGESVIVPNNTKHSFKACGIVISTENSSPNNDYGDNRFFDDKVLRFPVIIEDKPPKYLLFNELPGTEKYSELTKLF